ncbi:MAG: CBS domain-containing protein [Candidatus Aenigmarchaeota archaeon]|nr:CBS domain-containing protein [Candidatus Aenigmarchaeota archaeon]MDW8160265.1 CBS domain-containing protein [Candidatus Aenigmarchaeota archaeon]
MVLLVKDLMSKKVNVIGENSTVFSAAKLMAKTRRGYVVVVKKGKPVGILTDSDIIEKIVSKDKNSKNIKVKEVMSSPVIVTYPTTEISEASRIMRKNLIKRLPVIQPNTGKLIGILTETDIAKSTPEFLTILEERVEAKKEGYEPERISGVASGICEECGNYSETLYYVNGEWLCSSCKEAEERD